MCIRNQTFQIQWKYFFFKNDLDQVISFSVAMGFNIKVECPDISGQTTLANPSVQLQKEYKSKSISPQFQESSEHQR